MRAAPRCHRRASLPRLLTGGHPRSLPPRLRVHANARRTVLAQLRAIAGWIVLGVGLLGIVMPLNPAVIVIPCGVALIGRHHPVIRWFRTRGKLLLRASSRWPGWCGRVATVACHAEQRFAKAMRDRRLGRWQRPAPKEPIPTLSASDDSASADASS